MPAPPAQQKKKPPAWVMWGGLLLGALALLPFLPWDMLLRPPNAGGWMGTGMASAFRFMGYAMMGWGLAFSAFFGYWAARGSWAWAIRPSHPWLARCEAWTPLRGRWLLIAAAFGLWLLLWSAEWAAVIGLGTLPSMSPPILGIVGVLVIAGLGYWGAHLARRSTERSGAWNDPPPGPGEPTTKSHSG